MSMFRRSAVSLTPRAPLPCSSRHIASQWPGVRHTLSRRPLLARFESTVPAKENETYKYPELLNVYRSGVFKTVFLGMFRVVTLSMIPTAVLLAGTILFDPDSSNWWIPVMLLGSPIPYLVTAYTSGPIVHSIYIRLPIHARMSKVSLQRFIDSVPRDTFLRLECIRMKPWPTARNVQFGPLRRYRPSLKMGLSNLEFTPEAVAQSKERRIWQDVAKRWAGRYYVAMDQRKDRSAAPGLWSKIWKQIPERGTKEDEFLKVLPREKKPVTMANRPAPKQPQPPAATSMRTTRRTRR